MTISDTLRQARADLVANLESLSCPKLRATMLHDECVQTGGTIVPPSKGHWGPLNWEIELLGVYASGVSEDAAISAWTRAAARIETGLQTAEAA